MLKKPLMWKFLLSLGFCISFTPPTSGQPLQFESAFKNGEIPQIPIALLQDAQGFIWIGTTDGVYRYDGREVREFRHDPTDSTSISNNYINELYEDRKGNIWIGTKKGLNCYHPRLEKFSRHFEHQKNGLVVHSIIEDHKGKIWYGTYEGLWELNPKTNELLQHLPDVEQEQTLSNKLVWNIFEDNQQRIWVATHGGLTVFKNDGTYKFKPYYDDYKTPGGLAADRVFDFIQQPDSTVWCSTYEGIFRISGSEDKLQFQKFSHQKNDSNSLSNNVVFGFEAEGNHKIWAQTYAGGLNEIILPDQNNDSIRFIHHRHDPQNNASLSLDRVESFLIDRSGLIWVGTGTQLDIASKTTHKFHTIASDLDNENSLSNNIIKSIYQDSYGNLWIGTYDGLNFLSAENLQNKKFDFEQFHHSSDKAYSISNDNIFGIMEDSHNHLWINTFHGLNYLHIPTFLADKKFRHFNTTHGIPHTFNFSTTEIREGEYWLSTYGALSRMTFDYQQPQNVQFEKFEMEEQSKRAIVNSNTQQVIKDKFENYWIGTFNGISKYVKKDGNEFFENYIHEPDNPKSLSNNSFRCFFKDSQDRIWVGTRSGLNLIQQSAKDERATFKVFGAKDGLPNDVIHAIEEDDKGMLWISTNKGLVVFDPDVKTDTENPVRKIYDKQDGLTASTFVFRSSFKDEEGRIYFGTANGLNYFTSNEIPHNNHAPPIRFTKLKILNEVIKPGQENSSLLPQSITYTDKITLKHWQNIISLDFAALDFNKPEKNQYQYKLSGLNKDWVKNGSDNSVTFTNLSPGVHTLLVKGSNNDGVWNETPAKLIIEVLPPFWKTTWAYALYFLTFIGVLYTFIQFRIQQKINKIKAEAKLKKAREEERELLRKKNAADFHDELGHRLTKISLFLELAERQAESNHPIKKYLNKIKNNAAGLSEGVRDLIWSLDPKKDTMYQTLMRLQEFGDQLFEFSTTSFKTNGIGQALETIELQPDVRKHILLIFKETMNNCLKYAEARNAVLKAELKEGKTVLTFKDDGKGFDLYKIKKGYGIKNIQARAAKINAKIAIISKEKEGTTTTLYLDV